MAALSIPSARPPAEEGALTTRSRLTSNVIGGWIPALVGLLLAGLLHVESRPRDDLQLVAAGSARPGSSVGLRALFFPGDPRPEDASPVDVAIEVRLLTESGEPLATTSLRRSPRFGREGELLIPEGLEGRHILEARTALPESEAALSRRPIDIRADAPPLPRRGRLSTPLQRYQLFALEKLAPQLAPDHLEPRVAGGACVPELSCDLLVWVGPPGATVEVEGHSPEAPPGETPSIHQAVTRRRLTVHGSDATTRVVARVGHEIVATRRVQLPVALAAPKVEMAERLVSPPTRPELAVQSAAGESSWVVDLFHEGRWAKSLSISPDADGLLSIDGVLAPGLWRVQVRADPFPSSPAGAATFFVGDAGDSEESMLRRISAHPRQSEWLDPMARGLDEVLALEDADAELIAAFMLAPEESEILVLPAAVRGAEQSAEPEKLHRLRRYGAWLVLLLGLIVSYLLVTSEFRAGVELENALKAEGIHDEMLPVGRFRRLLLPLAVGLFVFILFGVVAYIVLSRGSW